MRFYWRARSLASGRVLNDGFEPTDNAEAACSSTAVPRCRLRATTSATPIWSKRLRAKHPLARFDRKTLYTPGAAGYTTYANYVEEAHNA